MSEWGDMIARQVARRVRISDEALRRLHRREMWDELGFRWFDIGVLGDLCFDMTKLTEGEKATFEEELERRVGDSDDDG